MSLIAQKMGGSSTVDAESVKRVAKRNLTHGADGHVVVVTVSAMGDRTSDLIELARQGATKPDPREAAMLLTTGTEGAGAGAGATS